ncbi:MAG TPA: hypothetical protein VGR02_07265 [Thermoanaerobaculia bacterium]|jgi:hypothetical protein|nr:hypothetical protein [Thermoanaerobaculia bacterium]
MKRLAMILVLLFTAATLFAGGKECEAQKKAAKSVELNGSLRTDGGQTLFRASDSGHDYKVCEKTKNAVLKLGTDGAALHVKGKVVSCGQGEELLIESANKI